MFTQKHFWALAKKIAADHETFTYEVAVGLADLMAENNSRFKRAHFMRAAGWAEESDVAA